MARQVSRRQFLTGAAGLATLAGAGVLIGARTDAPAAKPSPVAAGAAPDGDGTLVLCTLYGGNDGLNTVVPYEDPLYASLRGPLAIGAGDVMPIGGGLGLNKVMPKLKALWDQSKLAIVRGVAYPGLSFSHFQSMDTWQSADPSGASSTGWLGRWLDATNAGPLEALSVGPTLPLAFTGARIQAASIAGAVIALPGGSAFSGPFGTMCAGDAEAAGGATPAGQLVAASGVDCLNVVSTLSTSLTAGAGAAARSETGGASTIAAQLDLVRELMAAGLPTRAYGVSMTGFDTHAGEVATQTRLLGELDTAVGDFMDASAGSPSGQRTVLVVYSEFGRRVAANASGGTDHGSANDVYVVGHGVKGGFYGEQPSLSKLVDGNLAVTTDFRSVYATVMSKVLGVDPRSFLLASFPTLDFL